MKKILFALTFVFTLSSAIAGGHKAMVCSNISKEEFSKKSAEHHDKFLKKLKLSKEQDKQVKQIHQDHNEKMFAQVEKIRTSHAEFMTSVEKDASKEEIRARHSALQKEKQSLMDLKFEEQLAFRDILTPEQRKKGIAELKDKMKDMCD